MILKEIIYQKPDHPIYNKSLMTGMSLGRINLIVGKNGSGKSRLTRRIVNSAKMLADSGYISIGKTVLIFEDEKSTFRYDLINDGKNIQEVLLSEGRIIFERNSLQSRIFSNSLNEYMAISPPDNKLIFHSRRDAVEYPEVEKIAKWAEGVNLFAFGQLSINETLTESLPIKKNQYQQILEMIFKMKPKEIGSILMMFNGLGFNLKEISVKKNQGFDGYEAYFLEKGFTRALPISEMSQGMFRTLMLLFYLEYLTKNNLISTLVIDDLCEGVDYVRAPKLGKLLFSWAEARPNIQLIATSNDSFLMEVIPIEYWNILIREGNNVKCLNYQNSKKIFDEFRFTGLSPFDLFSSDYLLSKAA